MRRLYIAVLGLFPLPLWAATTVLPPSTDPSRVGQQIISSAKVQKSDALIPAAEKPAQAGEIPGADKIKFLLRNVEIVGNTVYPQSELQGLFQPYLNKQISLADLYKVTREITLKYRNDGYVVSRAVIPAQKIEHGAVKVQIVEGYVASVHIGAGGDGSQKLLSKYGNKLTQEKPVSINRLERYSLLANDIPGMKQVKVVLARPADSNAPAGATDVLFVPDFYKVSGFVGFDNRGTKYLGPNEFSAGALANSILQSGDQWGVQGLASSDWHELRYISAYTQQPILATGSTLTLTGNESFTEPGYTLRPLKVRGISKEAIADLKTPWVRSRKQNFSTTLSFDYLNSKTDLDAFNLNLYDDHIRSARLAANYSRQDNFMGINQASVQLSHGLGVLGASSINQPNLSRIHGDPQYTKWNASISRLQGITQNISFYIAGTGQYAYDPLLSSEQFTFGGSSYGQAYDPAEIVGDKGLAGRSELRYTANPQYRFLNNVQYFAFYDIGKVWNKEPESVNGLPQEASGASTGVGVRANFTDYMYGWVEMAKPLTRDVATMQDRNPRYFVGVTFTGKAKFSDGASLAPSDSVALGGAATNGPVARAQAGLP